MVYENMHHLIPAPVPLAVDAVFKIFIFCALKLYHKKMTDYCHEKGQYQHKRTIGVAPFMVMILGFGASLAFADFLRKETYGCREHAWQAMNQFSCTAARIAIEFVFFFAASAGESARTKFGSFKSAYAQTGPNALECTSPSSPDPNDELPQGICCLQMYTVDQSKSLNAGPGVTKHAYLNTAISERRMQSVDKENKNVQVQNNITTTAHDDFSNKKHKTCSTTKGNMRSEMRSDKQVEITTAQMLQQGSARSVVNEFYLQQKGIVQAKVFGHQNPDKRQPLHQMNIKGYPNSMSAFESLSQVVTNCANQAGNSNPLKARNMTGVAIAQHLEEQQNGTFSKTHQRSENAAFSSLTEGKPVRLDFQPRSHFVQPGCFVRQEGLQNFPILKGNSFKDQHESLTRCSGFCRKRELMSQVGCSPISSMAIEACAALENGIPEGPAKRTARVSFANNNAKEEGSECDPTGAKPEGTLVVFNHGRADAAVMLKSDDMTFETTKSNDIVQTSTCCSGFRRKRELMPQDGYSVSSIPTDACVSLENGISGGHEKQTARISFANNNTKGGGSECDPTGAKPEGALWFFNHGRADAAVMLKSDDTMFETTKSNDIMQTSTCCSGFRRKRELMSQVGYSPMSSMAIEACAALENGIPEGPEKRAARRSFANNNTKEEGSECDPTGAQPEGALWFFNHGCADAAVILKSDDMTFEATKSYDIMQTSTCCSGFRRKRELVPQVGCSPISSIAIKACVSLENGISEGLEKRVARRTFANNNTKEEGSECGPTGAQPEGTLWFFSHGRAGAAVMLKSDDMTFETTESNDIVQTSTCCSGFRRKRELMSQVGKLQRYKSSCARANKNARCCESPSTQDPIVVLHAICFLQVHTDEQSKSLSGGFHEAVPLAFTGVFKKDRQEHNAVTASSPQTKTSRCDAHLKPSQRFIKKQFFNAAMAALCSIPHCHARIDAEPVANDFTNAMTSANNYEFDCRCRLFNTLLQCREITDSTSKRKRWTLTDDCPDDRCCDLPCSGGELCEVHAPSLTPSLAPTIPSVPEIQCTGNRDDWESFDGGTCEEYSATHDSNNHEHCLEENEGNCVGTLCPKDVCHECGYCYSCDTEFTIRSSADIIDCDVVRALHISADFHVFFNAAEQLPNLVEVETNVHISPENLQGVYFPKITSIGGNFEVRPFQSVGPTKSDLRVMNFPHLESVAGNMVIENAVRNMVYLNRLEKVQGSVKISKNTIQYLFFPRLKTIGLSVDDAARADHEGGSLIITENPWLHKIYLPNVVAIGQQQRQHLCSGLGSGDHANHVRLNRFEVSNPRLKELHMPRLNNVAGNVECHKNFELRRIIMHNTEIVGGSFDLSSQDGNAHGSNPKLHSLHVASLERVCGKVDIRHTALRHLHLPELRESVAHFHVRCNPFLRRVNANRLRDVLGDFEVVNNYNLQCQHFLMPSVSKIEGQFLYFWNTPDEEFSCETDRDRNLQRSLSTTSVHDGTATASNLNFSRQLLASTANIDSASPSPRNIKALSTPEPTPAPTSVCDGPITIQNAEDTYSCGVVEGDVVVGSSFGPTFNWETHFPTARILSGSLSILDNAILTTVDLNGLLSISGDVSIQSTSSLQGIECPLLDSVGGHVSILDNGELVAVRMSNLTEIDGALDFQEDGDKGNPKLHILEFDNLRTIGSQMSFMHESALQEINFPALQTIVGWVFISDNDELLAVRMPNLVEIGGKLDLWYTGSTTGNPKLHILQFESLRTIGLSHHTVRFLEIRHTPALQNIHFPALQIVGGDVWIEANDVLQEINLPLIERVGGDVLILDNQELVAVRMSNLTDVDGALDFCEVDTAKTNPKLHTLQFDKLQTLGSNQHSEGLDIRLLSALQEISFPEFRITSGYVLISANDELVSVRMPNLIEIGNGLDFFLNWKNLDIGNPKLHTLQFDKLRTIGNHLEIVQASALQYIHFPILQTVGGDVWIEKNDLLQNISLPLIERVGGDVLILDNQELVAVRMSNLTDVDGALDFCEVDTAKTNPKLHTLQFDKLQTLGSNQHSEGLDIRLLSALQEISFPEFRITSGYVLISANDELVSVRMPNLIEIGNGLDFFLNWKNLDIGNPKLHTLQFDKLRTIGTRFEIVQAPALQEMNLPLLQSVDDYLEISDTGLQRINFPLLETIGDEVFMSQNHALVGLTMPILSSVGGAVTFSDHPALTNCNIGCPPCHEFPAHCSYTPNPTEQPSITPSREPTPIPECVGDAAALPLPCSYFSNVVDNADSLCALICADEDEGEQLCAVDICTECGVCIGQPASPTSSLTPAPTEKPSTAPSRMPTPEPIAVCIDSITITSQTDRYSCGTVQGDVAVSSSFGPVFRWSTHFPNANMTYGSIIIVGNSMLIAVDLNGLFTISGNVLIKSTSSLQDVECPLLESVGGYVTIQENNILQEINLPLIERVGGDVNIWDNDELVAVRMSNLKEITSHFFLWEWPHTAIKNPRLHTLQFDSLRIIGGRFGIMFLPSLPEVNFPSLERVGDELVIQACDELVSVRMPNLIEIGGKLDFWYPGRINPKLRIVQFESLRTIGLSLEILHDVRFLEIRHTPALQNIHFPVLQIVGADVWIEANDVLQEINLPLIERVGGDVQIWDNDELVAVRMSNLTEIDGALDFFQDTGRGNVNLHTLQFDSLRTIISLDIIQASALQRISFPALESVGGYVIIKENNILQEINLPLIERVGGDVNIWDNDELVAVRMSNLKEITSHFFLWEWPHTAIKNPRLHTLQFDSLRIIGGRFGIMFLPSLPEVNFPSLERVGDELVIQACDELVSVRMPNLIEIGGKLDFWYPGRINPKLRIVQFESLRTIGLSLEILHRDVRFLEIRHTPALQNIHFPALQIVGGDVWIEANDVLQEINLPLIERVGGDVQIWDNDELVAVRMSNLTDVGGDIDFWQESNTAKANPKLRTLQFDKLQTIGRLDIRLLSALQEISFPELQIISGKLLISANDELVSVRMSNLIEIGDDLDFFLDNPGEGNPKLHSLQFDRLRTIGNQLEIRHAPALQEMNLPLLQIIGHYLKISHTGLERINCPLLQTIGNDVSISQNQALVDLSVPNLSSLAGVVTFSDYDVLANCNIGCPPCEKFPTICSPSHPTEQPTLAPTAVCVEDFDVLLYPCSYFADADNADLLCTLICAVDGSGLCAVDVCVECGVCVGQTTSPTSDPTADPWGDCTAQIILNSTSDFIHNACVDTLTFSGAYQGSFDSTIQAPNLVRIASALEFEYPFEGALTALLLPTLESLGGSFDLRPLRYPPVFADLDLTKLRSVSGDFQVSDTILEEFALPSLETVTGIFRVYRNDALDKIDMPNLEIVGKSLEITNNPSLTEVIFVNLRAVHGSFSLSGANFFNGNPSLRSLNVTSLISIDDDVDISHTQLSSLHLLHLAAIGGAVKICSNTELTRIYLPQVETIQDNVLVFDNPILSVFDLGETKRIEGALRLSDDNFQNPILRTFNAAKLEFVGDTLDISGTSLEDIRIPLLNTINGDCIIQSNTEVTLIDMSSILKIQGSLMILSEQLRWLYMATLGNVDDDLMIFNTVLQELQLPVLTSVSGSLLLSDNDRGSNSQLEVVNLDMLDMVGHDLCIEHTALQVLRMPLLQEIGDYHSLGGFAVVRNNQFLSVIEMPELKSIGTFSGLCSQHESTSDEIYSRNRLDISKNAITQLRFSSLQSIAGNLIIDDNEDLSYVALWNLESIGGALRVSSSLSLNTLHLRRTSVICESIDVLFTALDAIDFPFLTSTTRTVRITCNPSLSSVDLRRLSVTGDVEITNNFGLAALGVSIQDHAIGGNYIFGESLGGVDNCSAPTDGPTASPTVEPTVIPTSAPTPTVFCTGDPLVWNAGLGDCSTYDINAPEQNYEFCLEDCILQDDVEECAADVCSECRLCHSSVLVPTVAPTIPNIFNETLSPTFAPTGNISSSSNNLNMSSLEQVGQRFEISYADMEDLIVPILQAIGGDAVFRRNDFLGSIQMPSLSVVAGSLHVSGGGGGFSNLTMLNFTNLTSLGSNLDIHGTALSTLFLPALLSIGASMDISNNSMLESIDLAKISSIYGSLRLSGGSEDASNFNLHHVNMTSIKIVGGGFEIAHTDLDEIRLPALESIGLYAYNVTNPNIIARTVHVHDNRALTLIDMPAVESVGRNLIVCESQKTSVEGHIMIHGNPDLARIDFSSISSIEGDLLLTCTEDDSQCQNHLHELNMTKLETLCGSIQVQSTALYEFLLPALKSAVDQVHISCNSELELVDLENLPSIHGDLQVVHNPAASVYMRSVVLIEGLLQTVGVQSDECSNQLPQRNLKEGAASHESLSDQGTKLRTAGRRRLANSYASTASEFQCKCSSKDRLRCQDSDGNYQTLPGNMCPETVGSCCDLPCAAPESCQIEGPTGKPSQAPSTVPTSPTSSPTSEPLDCRCNRNSAKLQCQEWNKKRTKLKWRNQDSCDDPDEIDILQCCGLGCSSGDVCLSTEPTTSPTIEILDCRCNSNNGKLQCLEWNARRTQTKWRNQDSCDELENIDYGQCCGLQCGSGGQCGGTSTEPSASPTAVPSKSPSSAPSGAPTGTSAPTSQPTIEILDCRCNSNNGKLQCLEWNTRRTQTKWRNQDSCDEPENIDLSQCCDLGCGSGDVCITPTASPSAHPTMAPSATPTAKPTFGPSAQPLCIGQRTNFDAGNGGCGSYTDGHPSGNNDWCQPEGENEPDCFRGFCAFEVCHECGFCVSPRPKQLSWKMEGLQTVGANVDFLNTDFTDIDLKSLVFSGGDITIQDNPSLGFVDMSSDEFIDGSLVVKNNDQLKTLNLPEDKLINGEEDICDNWLLEGNNEECQQN